MVNLFIDCNPPIQDCSLAYFQRMKNQGAKGAFIKVSEGQTWTTHTKGKSWEQAYNNSVQAGLMTGLYHFQRFTNTLIAIKEAQFFCKQLDAGGIGKQVKLMLDAEVAGASTATCIAFLQEMIRQGRTQLTTYTYKNFWQTVMDSHKLNAYGKIWLAGYKISSLGIDNVDAWQTADSWNGVSQDINTDYTKDNWFTSNATSQTTIAQSATVTNPVTTPAPASTVTDSLGVVWHKQTGTFTADRAINLRWGATTGSSLIATIKAGQSINYDQYAYSGGYVWIRQPRGNGQYGYMVTGQASGSKRINKWGSFK